MGQQSERQWSNLTGYPGIVLEGLMLISQDRQSADRELNPGPPEYDPKCVPLDCDVLPNET
jgi:hypothetical protein